MRRVELFLGLFEPIHVRGERRRALDKRGVSGLGFSRATPLRLHRLSRLEQAALRLIQLVVGRSLVDLDPGNGLARFVSPRFLAPELLFSRSPLCRDLLALVAQALGGRTRGANLQLIPDRRLLLTVQLAVQGCDGGLNRRDRDRDGRTGLAQAIDLRCLRFRHLTQFLDLSLG